MIDTGAAVSITGTKYHSNCESVVSIRPVILRSANGMHTTVNKQGLMHVKLNGKDMGRIAVLMVESPDWKSLLIGRKQLLDLGVTLKLA